MGYNGPLVSCDTFVVMGNCTESGETIFGKNSDRPDGEVQEVVFVPAQKYASGSKLKCTYIEIEQAPETYDCVLSKPEWMWGAEMGANQHGVVIGNEAVWDRLSDPQNDLIPRLLGMDLLRLGLERSKSAEEALNIITDLLEMYGQGGQCSNIVQDFSYHNSFLIADAKEAWVLETADRLWAAEKVISGVRNISNCMSITTSIDKCSGQLKARSKKEGWWDGSSEFNWTEVIGQATGELVNPDSRFRCGKKLLEGFSNNNGFKVEDMMTVLRDVPSGINRPSGAFPTAGSQVSVLSNKDDLSSCHWFTATASPAHAAFKPFFFAPSIELTHLTSCDGKDGKRVDQHPLWAKHKQMRESDTMDQTLEKVKGLETKYLELAKSMRSDKSAQQEKNIFNAGVEEEIAFY